MKIAIVGSRDYPRLQAVVDYVKGLPKGTIVISGGARGVDTVAAATARRCGLEVQIFPALWNTFGRQAGMIRNKEIVRAADQVIAFHANGSKGTANTIGIARKAGKPVQIFNSEGIEIS